MTARSENPDTHCAKKQQRRVLKDHVTSTTAETQTSAQYQHHMTFYKDRRPSGDRQGKQRGRWEGTEIQDPKWDTLWELGQIILRPLQNKLKLFPQKSFQHERAKPFLPYLGVLWFTLRQWSPKWFFSANPVLSSHWLPPSLFCTNMIRVSHAPLRDKPNLTR